MNNILFSIPGDPVAKGRPRHNRFGSVYTPEKTKVYETQVGYLAKRAMSGSEPFTGPVKLWLMFRMPVPASWPQWKQQAALDGIIAPTGKPDLDNLEKAILDGMNGIAYVDDAQITELTKRKIYSMEPGVDVIITPLDQDNPKVKRGELTA